VKIAVYPGTFDRLHSDNLDVIRAPRKSSIMCCDAGGHSAKKTLFTLEERASRFVKRSATFPIQKSPNATVWCGFACSAERAIVRGVRAVSDFDYEFQWAHEPQAGGNVSTVFLMPHERYTYLNSSIVASRRHGGRVDCFVPILSRRRF